MFYALTGFLMARYLIVCYFWLFLCCFIICHVLFFELPQAAEKGACAFSQQINKILLWSWKSINCWTGAFSAGAVRMWCLWWHWNPWSFSVSMFVRVKESKWALINQSIELFDTGPVPPPNARNLLPYGFWSNPIPFLTICSVRIQWYDQNCFGLHFKFISSTPISFTV